MGAQNGQGEGSLASEVIVALLDLAKLSQYTGAALPETPNATTSMLLQRLLALCAAQKGALVLTTHYPLELNRPSSSNMRILRFLALQDIDEQEVRALLPAFLADGPDVQVTPENPCWMLSRLPVGEVRSRDNRAEARRSQEFFLSEVPSMQTAQPFQALLLVGWTESGDSPGSAAIEKGRMLLPHITETAGVVLANILLTERVHELETGAVQKNLHSMELLKAELLATVSHELRSPLASIKGYVGTLLRHERRISREERHEFLVAIQQASGRLEVIIDRLLEMSQLDTGLITIELSPVDVGLLARDAITAAEQRVGQLPQSGSFSFHLLLRDANGAPASTEPAVLADQRRLREVLDDLVDNAVKYSPKGGRIDVIVRPVGHDQRNAAQVSPPDEGVPAGNDEMQPSVQKPEQMLEICVCDHGMGIPPEHLDRVFDRFHRVDTGLTREVSGLGLGLTICKRIVELHGGLIWAESCPEGGSAFHVWLPVYEEVNDLTLPADTTAR
jgi:signal transduction histidine kinase